MRLRLLDRLKRLDRRPVYRWYKRRVGTGAKVFGETFQVPNGCSIAIYDFHLNYIGPKVEAGWQYERVPESCRDAT